MPERTTPARRLTGALWAGLLYAYPLLLVLALWELAARSGWVRPLLVGGDGA